MTDDDSSKDRYPRPSGFYEAEERIQKSRFITQIYPLHEKSKLDAIMAPLRKQHYKANHHCFAWMIGHEADPPTFHYSDDGEPSGSAGSPIHRAILSSGLSDVLVVVIRYFGGIKLGTGGLARAYGGCAQHALANVPQVVCVRRTTLTLRFPYSFLNQVRRCAEAFETNEIDTQMSEDVLLKLAAPQTKASGLRQSLEELLMGRGSFLEDE
jgi:uncharacterized YigZ family protein